MMTPKSIEPLIQDDLVEQVMRQLISGKEADQRSFRQSASYIEGRKVKRIHRARAMGKGSEDGRKVLRLIPNTSLLLQVSECTHYIISSKAYC